MFILSLLDQVPYFVWPGSLSGGLGGLLAVGVLIVLLYRWRRYHVPLTGSRLGVLVILVVLVPVTSFFIGFRMPPGDALPPIVVPIDPTGPALMVFSAVPWVLAAGFLGPLAGAMVAAFSGLLLGLWDTHTPFTALELAFLGMFLGAALRQKYRTRIFQGLRNPVIATLLVSFFYPVIFLASTLLQTQGSLPVRLDFAMAWFWVSSITMAGQLVAAGVLSGLIAINWRQSWGGQEPYVASPIESSLENRVQYIVGTMVIVLVVGLMVGDWYVAGNAAEEMLQRRMSETAQMSSESIPFFLETGHNLINQIAEDPRLSVTPVEELNQLLAEHISSSPYFNQLYVLDAEGTPLDGYPRQEFDALFPTPEERSGIGLARQGVAGQYYSVPPIDTVGAAQISFITTVRDQSDNVERVLLGRTDLSTNPFTKPILKNLRELSTIGGEGMLLDEEGRILYHPLPNLIMTSYTGRYGEGADFFDDTAPDGTRNLVFYQPVLGLPWSVILTVSAQEAQQIALRIAAPLLGVLVALSIAVFAVMRLGVRFVTRSLHELAEGAERISQEELDYALDVQGEDEVGQLGRAFEEMRKKLKARLEELNQLLRVTRGVAESLDFETAVQPILEAAGSTGGCASYIVLVPDILPELEEALENVYSAGAQAEKYHHLSELILPLTEKQEQLALTNPARVRELGGSSEHPLPEAIFAAALRHESVFYGCMWVAYDELHQFEDTEENFLATLAGQAASAASNARSYLNAEIGRQRLQAILNSSPDPVLVTDHQDRMFLVNPAALDLLGTGLQHVEGRAIHELISNQEIIELLLDDDPQEQSVEIEMPDGRYFYASTSTVHAEGSRVGRVCILLEITRFKEVDAMKSEFVSSVSHDLRSPLTLMRGYATMLPMVGDLNEQQTGYVNKILGGVESMTRLVTNLLDLGRIETGVGLKLELFPVHDLVERVTGNYQAQAAHKRIHLGKEIPQHVTPVIEADQALIEQALQNLIDNAIKYTPTDGKVLVRLIERDDKIVFEVRDTGIGVAPLDIPRLFERFFRGARREARQQKGSGLGLTIVKSIADRHGGQVWVESVLGKGSRFFLEIPIRQTKIGDQPPSGAAEK